MRNIILTIATVLLSASLTAQGVFSNKTQAILEKVIQDYPNHFNDIKGELIQQTLQTTEYTSTVQLPGSASSIVTLSTHQSDNNSWTCVIFKAGNFEKARNSFQQIYGQLRNCIITTAGQKTFILSGQYEAPAEDKKSTSIIFSLLPGVGDMKRLKVELSLQEAGNGWTILLLVEDKDPKEEAQGAMTAN